MARVQKRPEASASRAYRLLCEARHACAPTPEEQSEARADILQKTLHVRVQGEWLDQIEGFLPYLERCIEEQRRFIEAHDEIVRVDQARKVDPESIRHLAQHSDFISRVDARGDVLPKRLMVIRREDSYAIYENRFLFTLVQQLRRFLDTRRREYLNREGCVETRIDWSALMMDEESDAAAQLRHTLRQSRPDEAADSPEGRRLLRLCMSVESLMLSPLMKQLGGTAPVSPPIVRTNVMKKNVNFQHALALYEALSKLEPPFFQEEAVMAEAALRLPEALEGSLEALARFQKLAVTLLPTEECERNLQAQTEREDALAEAERQEREDERRRDMEAKIEAARQQEIAIRLQEAAQWEARVNALREEKEQLVLAFEQQRQEAEERLAGQREQARAEAEALKGLLADARAGEEAMAGQLRQEQAAHEQTRREAAERLAEQKAEGEARLASQRAEAERGAEALRKAHDACLLQERREARKQAEQTAEKHKAELAEQRKREKAALRQRDDAHQKELRELRARLEAEYIQKQKQAAWDRMRQQKNWQLKLERAQQKLAKELEQQEARFTDSNASL